MCKWVEPAGQTSWTDQLDGPVLFSWSLGQFAYSKIDFSVCTLSHYSSPMKALFVLAKLSLWVGSYSCSKFVATDATCSFVLTGQVQNNCIFVCVVFLFTLLTHYLNKWKAYHVLLWCCCLFIWCCLFVVWIFYDFSGLLFCSWFIL